jgi:hypothetical protein
MRMLKKAPDFVLGRSTPLNVSRRVRLEGLAPRGLDRDKLRLGAAGWMGEKSPF